MKPLVLVSKFGSIVAMVTEKSYSSSFLVPFVPFTVRHHHSVTGRTPSVRARIFWIGAAKESKTGTFRQVLADKRGVAFAVMSTFNFFVSVTQIKESLDAGLKAT